MKEYINDAIDGLNKVKLDQDYVLRRGTDVGDLAGLFMQGDFNDNKHSLYDKTAEELNDMFADAVGSYSGFTSTSSLYDRGFSGGVEMLIKAPKGANACSIMSISRYGTDEGETLLIPGTKVKCVGVQKSAAGHMGSKIQVLLEIIVQMLKQPKHWQKQTKSQE